MSEPTFDIRRQELRKLINDNCIYRVPPGSKELPWMDVLCNITVHGHRRRNMRSDAFESGLDAAIRTLNSTAEVSDARGMTADEVADYLRRQREEEAGDDEAEYDDC